MQGAAASNDTVSAALSFFSRGWDVTVAALIPALRWLQCTNKSVLYDTSMSRAGMSTHAGTIQAALASPLIIVFSIELLR